MPTSNLLCFAFYDTLKASNEMMQTAANKWL